MKTIASLKVGFLLVSTAFFLVNDVNHSADVGKLHNSLLSCVWVPVCGDGPDLNSPILRPKDDKTETQDAKDDKLA